MAGIGMRVPSSSISRLASLARSSTHSLKASFSTEAAPIAGREPPALFPSKSSFEKPRLQASFEAARSAPQTAASQSTGPTNSLTNGRLHNPRLPICTITVSARSNNTWIHVNDQKKRTVKVLSAGMLGYKKAKRREPQSAFHLGKEAGAVMMRKNAPRWANVKLNGFGPGRAEALRGLKAGGVLMLRLTDTTPVVRLGCKPPKRKSI
eukprot:TRINITY_DN3491_c0_g1::TRINITY_DN3491_c0_g1_i1::g.20536::m.20536 TRINITY_DN3491_c0_g1::TRINITY_DN3491_c0_g1_i1::g.20536  ORF type:complete len:217 (-),score=4.84,sp/A6H5L4/RR11_CYCTA/37.19/3e-15,Ribosomal_S11/PF00411.14/9.3e-16 TRINITY_DN3491_c0_g1_i1:16-639(-)